MKNRRQSTGEILLNLLEPSQKQLFEGIPEVISGRTLGRLRNIIPEKAAGKISDKTP